MRHGALLIPTGEYPEPCVRDFQLGRADHPWAPPRQSSDVSLQRVHRNAVVSGGPRQPCHAGCSSVGLDLDSPPRVQQHFLNIGITTCVNRQSQLWSIYLT
jgi:hypothetical protein